MNSAVDGLPAEDDDDDDDFDDELDDDEGLYNEDDDDDEPSLGMALGGLQNALSQARAAAAEVVVGTAGNGAVTVSVSGGFEFDRVSIRADVVDPNDVELLEDLVLTALNDAANQLRERQQQIQARMMSGLGLGGDLGRLLGG